MILRIISCFLVFSCLELRAEKPEELLRTYYLPQFIQGTEKRIDKLQLVGLKDIPVGLSSFVFNSEKEQTQTLSELDIRKYLVTSFSKNFRDSDLLLNADLPQHLQIFGVADSPHLYQHLFPTQTLAGEVYAAYLLVSGPSSNLETILQRQKLIQYLSEHSDLQQSLSTHLRKIHEIEKPLLDLLDPLAFHSYRIRSFLSSEKAAPEGNSQVSEETRLHLLQDSTSWPLLSSPMKFPNFLLRNYASLLSLTFGVYGLKGIFTGFLTFGPASFRNCVTGTCTRMSILGFGMINTLLYGYMTNNLYMHHNEMGSVNKIISEQMLSLRTFLNELTEIDKSLELPEGLFIKINRKHLESLEFLKSALHSIMDCEDSQFFQMNFVRSIIISEELIRLQDVFEDLLLQLGKIDFYHGIAKTLSSKKTTLTYAEFLKNEKALVQATDIVNPWLTKKSIVANSLSLGTEHAQTIILTGPNASGKSTLMRAVGINIVYLAQTLGLASAKHLALTPISAFHGFMESKDITGTSSSYETDINRMISLIQYYRNLPSDSKAFLLVDEILSSTNSREALIGSKVLLEDIAKYPGVLSIISSHLYGLSELGEMRHDQFHNQHMEILRTDGKIQLTYRLREGKSTDNNARDIVSKEFAEFLEVKN